MKGEMLDRASIEITGRPLRINEETLRKAMDPDDIIEHRNIMGGPGRRQVIRMLKKRSLRIARERKWLAHEQGVLRAAKETVDSIARSLIKRG